MWMINALYFLVYTWEFGIESWISWCLVCTFLSLMDLREDREYEHPPLPQNRKEKTVVDDIKSSWDQLITTDVWILWTFFIFPKNAFFRWWYKENELTFQRMKEVIRQGCWTVLAPSFMIKNKREMVYGKQPLTWINCNYFISVFNGQDHSNRSTDLGQLTYYVYHRLCKMRYHFTQT